MLQINLNLFLDQIILKKNILILQQNNSSEKQIHLQSSWQSSRYIEIILYLKRCENVDSCIATSSFLDCDQKTELIFCIFCCFLAMLRPQILLLNEFRIKNCKTPVYNKVNPINGRIHWHKK